MTFQPIRFLLVLAAFVLGVFACLAVPVFMFTATRQSTSFDDVGSNGHTVVVKNSRKPTSEVKLRSTGPAIQPEANPQAQASEAQDKLASHENDQIVNQDDSSDMLSKDQFPVSAETANSLGSLRAEKNTSDNLISTETPDWLDVESTSTADVQDSVIVETLLATAADVDRQIDRLAWERTNQIIRDMFGNQLADRVQLTEKYVRDNYVDARYVRELNEQEMESIAELPTFSDVDSPDQFVKGFAKLNLDKKFINDIETRWLEQVRLNRLKWLGLIAAGLLAFLAIAFSFFNTDRATRGFYTVRLQWIAIAAFCGCALVLFLVGSQFEWF